jgi:MATE family multidrug resistance protein
MSTNAPSSDAHAVPVGDDGRFAAYGKLLRLSGPLILSQMGIMLMQIVDGVFLARYSETAIAAVGPSGMTFWLIGGLFMGLVGYSNTFVAQYVGAGQPGRVGSAVWQAVYLALVAGGILAYLSLFGEWFFELAGHAPEVRADEVVYFRILAWGGGVFLLSGAFSGFYAGRHDNVMLMVAHVAGGVTNAVFDALLIFGLLGFPRLGIAGAAWATVLAHAVQAAMLGIGFFAPRFRREFNTWRGRGLEFGLLLRLIRFGFPNGVRYVIEIAAWTVFLLIIGKIDSTGLAASNIAWRINGMAFFPVIGLSIAVSMLVGQAQGAGRPDLARQATRRGLVLGQVWMTAAAALMVLWPGLLLRLFLGDTVVAADSELYRLCVVLLRYVAVYCLLDNLNIIYMATLAGAGDTFWMLVVSGVAHVLFAAALLILAWLGGGTESLWVAATVFICLLAGVWVFRFRSSAWEGKRVVESVSAVALNPAYSEPVEGGI